MIIKNCAVCGKEFEARQKNYVHCSEECIKEGRARASKRYAKRKTHRLPEWRKFCSWIELLPHSEFITGERENG